MRRLTRRYGLETRKSSDQMDVVAYVVAENNVSARYRIRQYERYFADAGHRLTVEQFAPSPARRILQLVGDKRDKIVIVQRKLLPAWQTALLRLTSGVLVYDFDDAVYRSDSFDARSDDDRSCRPGRFRKMIRSADLIFAGNRRLAEEASRFARPDAVSVIPTCVDIRRLPIAEHRSRERTRLVWIGSSKMVGMLKRAESIIDSIASRHSNAMLRVICDRLESFSRMTVELHPWSESSESRAVAESDIGFSWIPDDEWCRGKCGLKILQYMAAGLPVLASPVGVHNEMIDAESGFTPRTLDQWTRAADQLIRDPQLRLNMGRAGRRIVAERYDIAAWAPVLLDRLAKAI